MTKKEISDRLSENKCALYVRVSTHYQIDKDSLPMQKEDLINYAKYALGIDKYEIFEDAGYSAKNTERPAFKQMMSRLRSGEFSHLVVWKIDRISRNLIDFAEMYAEIKKLGITFVSKNEQFDTSNAMGEAMLKIILVFAELERNMTSERVTAVMLARAANGQWNGGTVPFGYNYDKQTKEFSINESEAAVVKMMCDLYLKERSTLYVARKLNEKGFKTRNEKLWTSTTVSLVLQNPFYSGVYRYNILDESKSRNPSRAYKKPESEHIYIQNHHPPILEKNKQDEAIELLSKNKKDSYGSKTYKRKNTHVFSGILFCGNCGSQMQSIPGIPRLNGYKPSQYSCSRHRNFNDCDNKSTSDTKVGNFILNFISNIIKAQNNFGKSTSIETFERKLLRGTAFFDVEHIDMAGLQEMYEMLKEGTGDPIYSSNRIRTEVDDKTLSEKELLITEKRRKERALSRLKSLYLYNDDAISEKDFIIERKTLTDAIDAINSRLEQIEKNSSSIFSISDEDFMSKASVFIMTNHLIQKRYVDYEKLALKVEPEVIKEFINSTIKKVVIKNNRIMSIYFKNGIECKFLYKD